MYNTSDQIYSRTGTSASVRRKNEIHADASEWVTDCTYMATASMVVMRMAFETS